MPQNTRDVSKGKYEKNLVFNFKTKLHSEHQNISNE